MVKKHRKGDDCREQSRLGVDLAFRSRIIVGCQRYGKKEDSQSFVVRRISGLK